MIKYNLFCKDCETNFDSWFSSSVEFERIKKMKLLNCNHCDSQNIGKSLMTPNLLNTKKNKKTNDDKKFSKLKNKLKKYQKFIKNNFDYVGDNFTYEARSIHYNNSKKSKNIYGNATPEEVAELKEEGIDGIETIPWIKEGDN